MQKKNRPLQLTILWILVIPIFGLISGIIADKNAAGGEQKLFTYLAYSIVLTLIGVIVINVVTLIFSAGNKQQRLICLFLILLAVILLFPVFRGMIGNKYDVVEKTSFDGDDKIDIQIEYYDRSDTSSSIRSKSFWKNGKKDSIWVIYDKDGSILKMDQYKDDKVLKHLK